jgi:hypothetical protein
MPYKRAATVLGLSLCCSAVPTRCCQIAISSVPTFCSIMLAYTTPLLYYAAQQQSGHSVNSMVGVTSRANNSGSGTSDSNRTGSQALSVNARATCSAALVADVPSQLPQLDTAFLQAQIPELSHPTTAGSAHTSSTDHAVVHSNNSSSSRRAHNSSKQQQHSDNDDHSIADTSVAEASIAASHTSSSTRGLRAARRELTRNNPMLSPERRGLQRSRSLSLSPLKQSFTAVTKAVGKAVDPAVEEPFSKDAAGRNLRKALLLVTLDRLTGGEHIDSDMFGSGNSGSARSSGVECSHNKPQLRKKRLQSMQAEWADMQLKFDTYMKEADRYTVGRQSQLQLIALHTFIAALANCT